LRRGSVDRGLLQDVTNSVGTGGIRRSRMFRPEWNSDPRLNPAASRDGAAVAERGRSTWHAFMSRPFLRLQCLYESHGLRGVRIAGASASPEVEA